MTGKLLLAAILAVSALHPAAAAPERSCRSEIGRKASAALVSRCIWVSPATHPPCNAVNPCNLIRDEIARSCALFDPARKPRECGKN
jgi:hypothetical protein